MCTGCRTRGLPTRNVDCLEVLCHLGNLNRVQPAMYAILNTFEAQQDKTSRTLRMCETVYAF